MVCLHRLSGLETGNLPTRCFGSLMHRCMINQSYPGNDVLHRWTPVQTPGPSGQVRLDVAKGMNIPRRYAAHLKLQKIIHVNAVVRAVDFKTKTASNHLWNVSCIVRQTFATANRTCCEFYVENVALFVQLLSRWTQPSKCDHSLKTSFHMVMVVLGCSGSNVLARPHGVTSIYL